MSLLLNAVQAIDGAGTIRVEVSPRNGDDVITIVDTGRGIAPEHLPNIFRAFYTTKASGTGLGLSLARRIADEHHGRLEVTSEVGKGSTFSLVLPLKQASAKGASV
jgi:signal transduction histidine kinase